MSVYVCVLGELEISKPVFYAYVHTHAEKATIYWAFLSIDAHTYAIYGSVFWKLLSM